MTYTAKAGDTLSKIAKRNGMTLKQLLDINPQFKANPNKLKVGAKVNLPDTGTAPTQPLPGTVGTAGVAAGAVGAAAGWLLGRLSAKYETGGRGPGTVSTGSGDPGGVSYGSYQMATKTSTVARFVSQADFPWRAYFTNLKPGTATFTAKWKEIAANEPERFQECQHSFIKQTHFDLLVAKTLEEDGIDITKRSRALQDAVWSTAVQHGGNTPIIHRALAKVTIGPDDPDFDRQLISAIYAERGRKRPDGKLAYFPSSSPNVQKGVANRFKNEESDALRMLMEET
ncbi:MAG TPA: LysM domain-containing protein [Pyrinomonadaceae bacterium]